MPTGCAGIIQDQLLNCATPISGGVQDKLYLFNFDDIASYTVDNDNPNLVTGITLNSGARGFVFEGKNSSIEPRAALVVQRYSDVYDHEVTFKVFDNGPDVKKNIEGMVTKKVVAIVENRFKGSEGDAAFEIYGIKAGLKPSTLERITADTDTQGAYNVVLVSTEFEKEPNLPATFYSVSYDATKAALEALVAE